MSDRLTYYDLRGNKVSHKCGECGQETVELIVVRDSLSRPLKYVCSEICKKAALMQYNFNKENKIYHLSSLKLRQMGIYFSYAAKASLKWRTTTVLQNVLKDLETEDDVGKVLHRLDKIVKELKKVYIKENDYGNKTT